MKEGEGTKMASPVLRELAGPFRPFFPFEEPWYVYERGGKHLLHAWDHVSRQAIESGNAEELHAVRDDYQTFLHGHLKILDGLSILATRFNGEYRHPEIAGFVKRARDDIQKHYDSLFPRWQTLEDLEAILLERISLPNDRLKELAAKYPPPQSWYDEDETPRRRKKRS
jgi:hypothetical protein